MYRTDSDGHTERWRTRKGQNLVLWAPNFMKVIEQRIQATTEPGLEPRSIVLMDDWVYMDVHEGALETIRRLRSFLYLAR